MNRAIFFDRDGILNKAIIKNNRPYSPLNIKELKINKNLQKKIIYLKKYFKIFIVTNQPEISRGNLKLSILKKQNDIIKKFFKIDDIFYCPHDSSENCNCRKPKTKMFLNAKKKYKINFSKSYCIGDRWKDIHASNKLKINSIFIDYNYSEKKPKKYFAKFKSVSAALKFIKNKYSN